MYNIFYFDHLGKTQKLLVKPVPKETAMKTADEFDENVYPVRRRGPYPVSKSWIGADV